MSEARKQCLNEPKINNLKAEEEEKEGGEEKEEEE